MYVLKRTFQISGRALRARAWVPWTSLCLNGRRDHLPGAGRETLRSASRIARAWRKQAPNLPFVHEPGTQCALKNRRGETACPQPSGRDVLEPDGPHEIGFQQLVEVGISRRPVSVVGDVPEVCRRRRLGVERGIRSATMAVLAIGSRACHGRGGPGPSRA